MKVLKYLLLVIGLLGLVASIYHMVYEGTISNNIGSFISSLVLFIASFNLDKLSNGFKNIKA